MIAIRITNMPNGEPVPGSYYLREVTSDAEAQTGSIQGGDLSEALLFTDEGAASQFLYDQAMAFPPLTAFGIALETPTLH